MLTNVYLCNRSALLLRRCLGRYQWLHRAEEAEPGAIQQEPGHLPNDRAAAWSVAFREGADDDCPWTPFDRPEYAQNAETAGSGKHCTSSLY